MNHRRNTKVNLMELSKEFVKTKTELFTFNSSLCERLAHIECWFEVWMTERRLRWEPNWLLHPDMNLEKSYVSAKSERGPNAKWPSTIGKQIHLTSRPCNAIPAFNYNLFSGWPNGCSLVNTLCPLSKNPNIFKFGISSWPSKTYSRNSLSWPEKIVGQLFELLGLHIRGGWGHFTKWKHDNGPIVIFVTESLPERALSSSHTLEHLLLSRIKSLAQGALIMIELGLFVQISSRLWRPVVSSGPSFLAL